MSRRGENIRKRSDGRWEGRYIFCDASGIKKCRSVYDHTYHGVKQKLLQSKSEAANQPNRNPAPSLYSELTVDALSQMWLSEVLNSRKYSTYRKYTSIYEKYIKDTFGNMKVSELRSEIISSRLPKNLSSSLCKSIYCVFNRILNYGSQYFGTDKIHLVPFILHQPPKPVYIINTSDQQKLIAYLMRDLDIYKTGILICLFMGLRLGEICALKWEDINLQNQTLHINRTVQRLDCSDTESNRKTILYEGPPKTPHSMREIPIPEYLMPILLSYHNVHSPSNPIYFLNSNTPMDPRTYQYKFQSYLRKAGITATHFHALRHTFATNCINNGADAKSVSEILGHANVNITLNRYVHPDMATKRHILNSITSPNIQ